MNWFISNLSMQIEDITICLLSIVKEDYAGYADSVMSSIIMEDAMNDDKLDHVRATSSEAANKTIDQKILASIQLASNLPSNELNTLIKNLEKEWDIERILEMNASTFAFIGVVLAIFISSYWLIIPLIVLPFLFLHAIQGWCPPIPLLRGMGIRTRKEIDTEKFALKVVRGDFDGLKSEKDGVKIFDIVRK